MFRPISTSALLLSFHLLSFGLTGQQAPEAPSDSWLVQFTERSFDLEPLRSAIVTGDSAEAQRLIREFEASAKTDQDDFRRAVEARGGKVRSHWWIINGCHVRASAAAATELATLPNVFRVEKDEFAKGTDNGKPLDHFNHGTELLYSIGLDGTSLNDSIIAILDSGLDENVAGIGRPHRAFYRDGDPSTTTPGGIGGSRIVLSQQFGVMPTDDAHGHGTRVGAIAAGANWGTPSATDGHAKGALIANYAIGDSIGPGGGIFALYSSMISAWQQVLVDRATHNIVVANLSFGGEQDPLHATQQALDSAARIGDILICVSAGNSGPSAFTGQQSCANGLAVASAFEDSHAILTESSRGPMVNDSQRTYPDITAVAMARVPNTDCEDVNDLFGGTSAASARVAGAAMTLRASVPSLQADETKAILLASSYDISERNPSMSVNAYGAGLMRQDQALITAATVTQHARDLITTPGTTLSLGIPTVQGQHYRVALAWMRGHFTSTNWSDLNLAVVNPFNQQTLVTSNSPRNLYEYCDFVAPPGGLVVIEVSAVTIENSMQEFAVAISAQPEFSPQRGWFTVGGAGCEGPVPNGVPTCAAVNDGAQEGQLIQLLYTARFEHAIELVAPPGGLNLTGFEIFTSSSGPATLQTAVYLDAGGQPQPTPVRTGTMLTDDPERWYRTEFGSPVNVPAGQSVWVGVSGWSKSKIVLDSSQQSETTRMFWRDRCAGSTAWGGSYLEFVGARALCSGTAVGEVPYHTVRGAPRIGEVATLDVERLEPLTNTIALIGFSDQVWTGGSLPFDISLLGGTGCLLHVDPIVTTNAVADPSGRASVTLPIPFDPAVPGWPIYTQYLILDFLGPRTLTSSNSGRTIVGRR